MPEGREGYRPAESRVIKELEYPKFWSAKFIDEFAKVPENLESQSPETPTIKLDLAPWGYGTVWIKNEADRRVNPTGTMKDRMGRVYASVYGHMARFHQEVLRSDAKYGIKLSEKYFPRYSIITSGNAGVALARAFESYNLPPPKLLLDSRTDQQVLARLQGERADLYLTDLGKNAFSGKTAEEEPLSGAQVCALTNNSAGFDITEAEILDDERVPPGPVVYNKLAKDVLKHNPHEIYVPYGSGALFDALIFEQRSKTATRFPKIFGVEPEGYPSFADKLAAPVKPYTIYSRQLLGDIRSLGEIDTETGIYRQDEDSLRNAYELLSEAGKPEGIETEPSGSAGMAQYMARWKQGLISDKARVEIINTGRGVLHV